MNPDRETIDASYRYCRRMSRRAGSSFHAGFMLLPLEKRRAMWALYAFMRHTDDLADGPLDGRSPCEALTEWRSALELALNAPRLRSRGEEDGREAKSEERREKREYERIKDEGGRMKDEAGATLVASNLQISKSPNLQIPSSLILHTSSFNSLLPALADTIRRFQIPPEHLRAVIDGVEMDLDGRRYETFDDLRPYCERVASAVGLACIHVWGFRGPEAFEPARAAGVALQLTNILRDLREDAAAGRVYLPLADMRECGYSLDDLRSGVINEPFLRLMKLEIGRAREHYRAAGALLEYLHPDGRRIFGTMFSTYRELLRRIERRPADVLRRRVRVGRAVKLMILARWSLFPPRKADSL